MYCTIITWYGEHAQVDLAGADRPGAQLRTCRLMDRAFEQGDNNQVLSRAHAGLSGGYRTIKIKH